MADQETDPAGAGSISTGTLRWLNLLGGFAHVAVALLLILLTVLVLAYACFSFVDQMPQVIHALHAQPSATGSNRPADPFILSSIEFLSDILFAVILLEVLHTTLIFLSSCMTAALALSSGHSWSSPSSPSSASCCLSGLSPLRPARRACPLFTAPPAPLSASSASCSWSWASSTLAASLTGPSSSPMHFYLIGSGVIDSGVIIATRTCPPLGVTVSNPS